MRCVYKIFILVLITLQISCGMKEDVDLIITNAKIYTIDSAFTIAEAIAVKDGRIIGIATNKEILSKYKAKQIEDLDGKFIYPGFRDAHCHFYGYAKGLQYIDLKNTKSFNDILIKIKDYSNVNNEGWIRAWGWDQNLWEHKEFPNNDELNKLFPTRPIVLVRIDGHAVLANNAAIKAAGIKISMTAGYPTGIFMEKDADIIKNAIPLPTKTEMIKLLKQAELNCFAVGLTSASDAGLDKNEIELIDSLQKKNELMMKTYVMLSNNEENIENYVKKACYKTHRMNICSIKLYADGALGSRGALMLEPYSDMPNNKGIAVITPEEIIKIGTLAIANGFQVNTHAIGDSAVRMVLNAYASLLKTKNDKRWRIEHAQVVNSKDFELFKKFNIIPAINTTHATSDMNWAEQRLGKNRIINAYAYKKLLEQNGWLPNGSDFPIEQINPLLGFYAAVSRKDANGLPNNGFMKENALSRYEAIKAMTIWAAKASFEDTQAGSLEIGKTADFVICNQDIMNVDEGQILKTEVLFTYIDGIAVYAKK